MVFIQLKMLNKDLKNTCLQATIPKGMAQCQSRYIGLEGISISIDYKKDTDYIFSLEKLVNVIKKNNLLDQITHFSVYSTYEAENKLSGAIEELLELKNLIYIDISSSNVTGDASLLLKLENLKEIDISNTKITNIKFLENTNIILNA